MTTATTPDTTTPETQSDYTRAQLALRPHQQAAFDTATEHLTEHDRVTICMPCGSGKTLLGQRLAQSQARHGRSTILVLVPTVALLSQTLRAWVRHSPRPLAAFVLCHDDTVSSHELRVPVSTSPQALADWSDRTARHINGPIGPQMVVFATYQSSPRVAQAHKEFGLAPFHCVIADEAHCCAGEYDAAFATVVDDTKIHAAVRVFLTATPRVRGTTDSTAWCMDDRRAFGPIVTPLGLREAIDARLLSDYVVAIVAITDNDIRTAIADTGLPVAVDGRGLPGEQVAAQLAIAAAARTFGLRRIMVFHNSVDTSRAFTESLAEVVGPRSDAGALVAMHVDGTTPARERASHLAALTDPGPAAWAVLSNVRCFGQGIDVPAIDGLMFAGPRSSPIDIAQCVGRALRLDASRDDPAVILLPVLVAAAGDIGAQVLSSRWRHVYRTLLALADYDAELAAELATTSRRKRRGAPAGPNTRRRVLVLDAAGAPTADELRDAMQIRALTLMTPGWDYGYHQLVTYADEHGHARVPTSYRTPDGYALGLWVRGCRSRRQQLTTDQVHRLESVLGWAWNAHDAAWWDAYQRLLDFRTEHGHTAVPEGHRCPDGFALDKWAAAQRTDARSGALTQDRRAALDAAAFTFTPVQDRRTARMAAGLDHLREFAAEHGHVSPVQSYVSTDGFPLGQFTHWLRRSKARDTLPPGDIAAVEAFPDWQWDALEARWRAGLGELAAFKATYGHTRVPRTYMTPGGQPLGKWLANQRQVGRCGSLAAHRRRALEDVDPDWDKPLTAPRRPR